MNKKKIHNKKELKENRKELRNNLTSAEATLWKYLQRKQLEGRKFRRQHSIGNYIVDFYCAEEKITIELDGAYHLDFARHNYDMERTKYIEKQGITELRFENKLVFEDIEVVLDMIKANFRK